MPAGEQKRENMRTNLAIAIAPAVKVAIHGTPLTPKRLLPQLAGRSFCVSFADPRQAEACAELVGDEGILMLDNGAFSAWTKGRALDVAGYEAWALGLLKRCPQALAVVPDVIGGTVEQNAELIASTRLPLDRSFVVWHLDEPLSVLAGFCRRHSYVAFGSAGAYWQVGSEAWAGRVLEALAVVDASPRRPFVHMMRGLSQLGRYDFDSADSTNVARNHCRYRHEGGEYVRRFADRIEAAI
jgi:hypothetical protein